MARFEQPTPEDEADYRLWVAGRPEPVRLVAERFEPWSLYALGHRRVTVVSFDEHENGDVTITVSITGDFNLIPFNREVFGIEPDELTPCDPPHEDEVVGTLLTEPEDVQAYINSLSPANTQH